MLSPIGEIRRDDGCLEYAGGKADADKDDKVIVIRCHGQKGNQYWIYDEVCFIAKFIILSRKKSFRCIL
jgi:polypeptide N-acetylgalactosaminyltransferase